MRHAAPEAVTTGFGSCKRHAQNGLTATADRPDGLCADCRSAVTAGVKRRNTYGGSQPLATEPPHRVPNPKGGTGEDSTARKAERLARFRTALTGLTSGDIRDASPAVIRAAIRHASSAAVREAGAAAGVGERTASEYHRELKRELGRTP